MTAAAPFTDPAAARNYILAGNAYVTLLSKVTGKRYTYRVRRAKDDKNAFFASVLYGQSNVSDYRYVGVIKHGVVTSTNKCELRVDDPRRVALGWALANLTQKQRIPAELEIWHNGKCGRCGRMLSDPESVARGLGPHCAGL